MFMPFKSSVLRYGSYDRRLEAYLRAFVNFEQSDWARLLPMAQFAYFVNYEQEDWARFLPMAEFPLFQQSGTPASPYYPLQSQSSSSGPLYPAPKHSDTSRYLLSLRPFTGTSLNNKLWDLAQPDLACSKARRDFPTVDKIFNPRDLNSNALSRINNT